MRVGSSDREQPWWDQNYSAKLWKYLETCMHYYFEHTGFMVDYVSHPVIQSFTQASVVTVIVSQIDVSHATNEYNYVSFAD